MRQLERLPDSDSGPRFLTPSTAGQAWPGGPPGFRCVFGLCYEL